MFASGSDDSEYESAAEASFVEPNTPQPSRSLKSDTGLDFLINGLSSLNVVTPCPKRPVIKFQFPSPAKIDENEVFVVSSEIDDDGSNGAVAKPVVNLDDSFMSAFNKMRVASVEVMNQSF